MSKRNISKQEYQLLHQLLTLREQALIKFLPRILKKHFSEEEIHATKDYIYTTGDIPVTLIAHLDTVHPYPPIKIFHDPEEGAIWAPRGLGADDRAGVFSILQILKEGYRPSIIFTTGEEVGGTGARKFIEDFPFPLVDTLFLIELDRQGSQDAVYYDCGNRDFENFITTFGFTTNLGSFSDIVIIGSEWDRASVNLSIGYIDEHLTTEMLFYRDMFITIEKVEQILKNCGDIVYKYLNKNRVVCDLCVHLFEADKMVWVRYDGQVWWHLCDECAKRHTSECRKCGRRFLNPYLANRNKMCEDCEYEYEY